MEPEPVNEDDHMMATDLVEPAERKNSNTKIIKQNEKLYTAEGILDPHKRRADEKKRRKAVLKASRTNAMDADYDFKIDYLAGEGDVPVDLEGEDLPKEAPIPMDGVE